MNEESKGMKLLYTVFLITITAHTVVLLMDRWAAKKERASNGIKDTHG